MTANPAKQMRAAPWFTGQAFFLLLVCALLAMDHSGPSVSAQRQSPTKTSQPAQPAAVIKALQASFGSSLEAVKAFRPYYLTGDFNGDGAPDVVVAVRIKGQRSDLPADVTVYNPFARPKAIFPADPLATPTLALAIIHGKTDWQTSPAAQKFLLFGESPVLILNYRRVTSGGADEVKNLMELLKKGSPRLRDLGWPPATAKGDAIVLGAEATDSILYWNGKNYRWEEAAGGE